MINPVLPSREVAGPEIVCPKHAGAVCADSPAGRQARNGFDVRAFVLSVAKEDESTQEPH